MQDYIFGYGSLMSHDSRLRFSDIDADGVAVTLKGWRRDWNMACRIENFTCVGLLPDTEGSSQVNGKLFPVAEISEKLQKREQNYQFVQIDESALRLWHDHSQFPWTNSQVPYRIWLCRLRREGRPEPRYPIYQSYVDTCLIGCLEDVGESFARLFLRATGGWQGFWVNDRDAPMYPRGANLTEQDKTRIDELLNEEGYLQFRQEPQG